MSLLNQIMQVHSFVQPQWLDDQTILYKSDQSGLMQLWSYKLDDHTTTQVTDYDNYIQEVSVHRESGQIAFTMSQSGNEVAQIYLMRDGQVKKVSQDNLATHFLGDFTPDGKALIFTANRRNREHFDLYCLNLETLTADLWVRNEDNYNFPKTISPDGRYMVYQKLISETDQMLWIYDRLEKISFPIHSDKARYDHPVWIGNDSFLLISNLDSEFMYLACYKVSDRRFEMVKEYKWDVETFEVNETLDYLAVIINENGYSRLEIMELASMTPLNHPRLPMGEIAYYDQIAWHGNRLLLPFSSGSHPSSIWLLDLDANSLGEIISYPLSRELKQVLVEPLLRQYQSFDGLMISYWLYLPRKARGEQMPVVIEVHGGPEAQERTYFNEMIQYFLSEGIAVVAPNVRGSTGYGKTFESLDDKDKRLDSVKDIESLVNHLIEEGIADKDRVAISGTSYGGFMTLSCAARYPDLFCAAIDNVGMYNLVTFLELTADYRRPHRESEYGSLESDRDMLYGVSPVSQVDCIKGPLMVIHGKNDPRVPVYEAEQVVEYLTNKGVEVHYICYEDEGHGLSKLENKVDCYTRMMGFLKGAMEE